MRMFLSAVILSFAATVVQAAHLIVKPSAHDVTTTVNRLHTAIEDRGLVVFARVDHAASASKVDQVMAPNEVLIFGGPALLVPIMLSSYAMGVDLPLKVHVYETEQGEVVLVYRDILRQAEDHNTASAAILKAAAVLNELTDAAVATE